DVMLPDIDGFQVLARLRADPELASTPVFILSILGDRDQGMQHGAQEYFSKPIDKEKLLEAVSRLVQKTPREDVKILVVDDDPHILQAVTRHLQQRGYHNTLTAGDGLESVVRARDQHPDLIILDIYMPDMDGFEVIRQLRSRDDTCQIPIIVLTASDIPVDEIRAHSLGVQEFMNKPFSEKELARAVRQALGQVQQGRKVDEEDSGR
ncbi:MAG TPA: response regulator, partial [Candidatus Xenobia bacterium]